MYEKNFVIGSNSFSGSHFVNKALKNGYKVMGISRSPQPASVFCLINGVIGKTTNILKKFYF